MNSMHFDLTDMRLFLHAYDAGTMTQAAARGHLTLAAVSARIRALEEQVGIPLLHRHARGVKPTLAGEVLARHARIVLRQIDRLSEDLLSKASGRTSCCVILGNSSALARPIGALLAEVLSRRPDTRLEVRESPSEVTVQALMRGASDLGIVSDAVSVEGLSVQLLGEDPLVLVAAEGHELARNSTDISFAELLAHEWIGWNESAALSTHLALHAFRAGKEIRFRAVLPSVSELLELVTRGFGITVLPAALLTRSHGMVTRPLKERWAKRKLLLCTAPDPVLPHVPDISEVLVSRWPR